MVAMNWVQHGSVVEFLGGACRTAVSYDLAAARQPPVALSDDVPLESMTVWLGAKQARRYELRLTPQDSGRAVASCHGIARLLASIRGVGEEEQQDGRLLGVVRATAAGHDNEGLFRSTAMLGLLSSARRVAPLGITVLLTGESGTGKEVLASVIHRASGAPQDAYFAFNCATVPRDMVDSQLFGYRRGAFTGAMQGFGGVIGAADGGTLLLDEVGELPLETQPKLLRFLDSGEVQALGEATARKLKVRVIAATNADLENLVQLGRFREDLYYRLNVVRFRLPPLRERREEILPLVEFFLSKHSLEYGKHDLRFSDAALEHLLLYSWPGNVRQLSHEIRRLVALGDSDSVIDVKDLDPRLRGVQVDAKGTAIAESRYITVRIDGALSEVVKQVESAAIRAAIEATQGRMDLAAERLGLSRKGLYLKRQRLRLS
jgi:DNA-binding NtrC family response regulator